MKNIGQQFEQIFMLSRFQDLLPEQIIQNELLLGQLDSLFSKTEFGNFEKFSNSKFAKNAFKTMKANNLDLVLEKHCEEDAVKVSSHQAGLYDNEHDSFLSIDLDPNSAVIILNTNETEYSVVADNNLQFVSFETTDVESGDSYRTNYIQTQNDGISIVNYENGRELTGLVS